MTTASSDDTANTEPGRSWRRWRVPALVTALAAAGITAGLLLTAGPGSITVNGFTEDCIGAEQAGQSVTVLDSDQHVIGTGTLADDNSRAAQKLEAQSARLQAGLGAFGYGNSGMSMFKFTAQVPAGQPRYGIQVASGNHGTVWFTERQMRNGPGLNLGC